MDINNEEKKSKKMERMEDIRYELGAVMRGEIMPPKTIRFFSDIERKDLGEEAVKILLDDTLKKILEVEVESGKKVGNVGHFGFHAANRYLAEFGKQGVTDRNYHVLAQGLIKLNAIYDELDENYQQAEELYNALDMTDKASEMKSKFESLPEKPWSISDIMEEKRKNGTLEEHIQEFELGTKKAIKDFQAEFSSFPLMSNEERTQIAENIKKRLESE